MTLASRLIQIRQRIANACLQHGRVPNSVQLLAVSKFQNVTAMTDAYTAGLRHFGENYVQEAVAKMPELPDDCVWHCIGPLQSNKSKWVAEQFSWCQSVDSLKLAERLSRQREGRLPLSICLQLHLGDEASKSGLYGDDLLRLADAVAKLPNLQLRGLMTIPPAESDVLSQRYWFAQARSVFEQLQRLHPQADTLSMGMSADLEAAIAEGSTMVRIGTALFGSRPVRPDSGLENP